MERVELEQWKGREVARLLALVESERRYYQEIVATLPVGLLVVSSELSVVSSNRAARKILGVRGSDPARTHLESLLPSSLVEKIKAVFKGSERVENLMVDHAERRLRVSVLPIRNGDDDVQHEALISIEDLTGTAVATAPAAVVETPLPAPAPVAEAPKVPPVVIEQPAVETLVPPVAEKATPVAPAAAAAQTDEASNEPAGAEAVELLQSLDAIIWAVEVPTMNFLFVTNTAEEVLGFNPDHWLSTPSFWTDRIHPDDREATIKSYEEAMEDGQRHSCEFRALTASGRVVWLRETARILTDSEGNPKHLIGLTMDISERRRMEEHQIRAERMEAIGKLASRLSHDLNNMLMIVNGYGEELLHNVAKKDPLRSDVQEILTATNRITVLTNDLLAFTRRQPVPAETLDLSEVGNGLMSALNKICGPAMTVEIESDPGLQAKAGRMQLDQLLTNLAIRARTSMQESGRESGWLKISMGESQIHEDLRRPEHLPSPGLYSTVTVEDTAGPLTHEQQMALFESFLPVRELPGETGAILSRSYTFVRQWGGDISVEPTANGSRVTIFLPYAGRKEVVVTATPEPEVVAPPVEAAPPAPVAEPELETILVVEDEGGIRALVRKILRRQGYTVLEAAGGEEAQKICRENTGKIQLLITDVMMPNMSGRELVDALKRQCGDMKVLYVSGYTDDAAIYAGDFPPGTAFLQKPFTLGSLLDKVKEVLSQ